MIMVTWLSSTILDITLINLRIFLYLKTNHRPLSSTWSECPHESRSRASL